LGGAAVHRCDNGIVLIAASAAVVTLSPRELVFPQPGGRRLTAIGHSRARISTCLASGVRMDVAAPHPCSGFHEAI